MSQDLSKEAARLMCKTECTMRLFGLFCSRDYKKYRRKPKMKVIYGGAVAERSVK